MGETERLFNFINNVKDVREFIITLTEEEQEQLRELAEQTAIIYGTTPGNAPVKRITVRGRELVAIPFDIPEPEAPIGVGWIDFLILDYMMQDSAQELRNEVCVTSQQAIVAVFKPFKNLISTLSDCELKQEGEDLLAEIQAITAPAEGPLSPYLDAVCGWIDKAKDYHKRVEKYLKRKGL